MKYLRYLEREGPDLMEDHLACQQSEAKTDPLNYRPISLLPIISKIMESIIAVYIISFLFPTNLISDSQVRFRPGHYT